MYRGDDGNSFNNATQEVGPYPNYTRYCWIRVSEHTFWLDAHSAMLAHQTK